MPKRSPSNSQHRNNTNPKMTPTPATDSTKDSSTYAAVAVEPSPHGIPSPPHSTADDEKERLQNQGYDLVGRAIEAYPPGKSYATGIDEAPLTLARTPYIPGDTDPLLDPGTARATIAASNESPNGSVDGAWTRRHQHQTVLHQHVTYWDPDADSIIWPTDTYTGCRRFGWAPPLALLAAYLIHVGLSYPTVSGWLPDPFFRIYVSRIHKAKHGSGSMAFDNEGRFRPQQFEDLFAKYDEGGKGGLDGWDLLRAWRGQMLVGDFFGALAAGLEWFATYLLLWPEDGIMRKEDVRRVFDGSIFQHKADVYAEKKRRAKKAGSGSRGGGGGGGAKKSAAAWWSKPLYKTN